MGLITCRNADAPPKPECSIEGLAASGLTANTVTIGFMTLLNGSPVETLGSVCYRVVGSTPWLEAVSLNNGPANGSPGVHTATLTGLSPETAYEYQAKANLDGCLCESAILAVTTGMGTTVDPDPDPDPDPIDGDCCVIATAPNFMFEAEIAEIPAGSDWMVQSGNGSTGSYIVYDQPSLSINNNENDILKFYFEVPTSGVYELNLLSSGLYDTAGDKNNDVWVQIPGTGNAPGQTPTAGVWKKIFRSFSNPPGWAWNTNIDPDEGGGEYYFTAEAGTKYCIQLAGRSGQFYIDRIGLHLMGSGEPEEATLTACTPVDNGGGGVTPPGPDEIELNPTGKPTATGRFKPCDFISVHYDSAPDPDDIHAAAAGSCVLRCYGISSTDRFAVAAGAYGLNKVTNGNATGGTRWGDYNPGIESVLDAAYGNAGWYQVRGSDNGQFLQVATFATLWKATLDSGCDVWVADGGPMDFTAQVAQYMQNTLGCTAAELSRIHVVQHSHGWNEINTLPANVTWITNNLDYIKIDNGNLSPNSTADLRSNQGLNDQQNGLTKAQFFNKVNSGPCGAAWAQAESAFSANTIDFSDTVELLYILNISQGSSGTIKDIDDFCDTFAT